MPTVLVHPFSNSENSDTSSKNLESFSILDGEILYDALEKQGVILAHGCLSGSCGACCIEVTAGYEKLSPIGRVEEDTLNALQANHPDKKIRLACRMKVMGDIEVKKLK